MIIRHLREDEKNQYDQVVSHPLQSWAWGDFRKLQGSRVVRIGSFEGSKLTAAYQLYSTQFPRTDKTVWLLLRGPMPDEPMLNTLKEIAQKENAIFIKIEPNIAGLANQTSSGHQQVSDFLLNHGCVIGKPFFATHTFWIDLTLPSQELFSKMKEKTRYNIRLAQKHGVQISLETSPEAFESHLDLMFQTTQRQNFSAHDKNYHRQMWQLLSLPSSSLQAHLLQAKLNSQVLASWLLFSFHNTLYYPYGASSSLHREVMASHALMWGAIEYGKKLKLSRFDLWGAAAPNYLASDPWAGFTRFKEGFSPEWISFVGSFDLVANPLWYRIYQLADKLRSSAKKIGINF